MPAGTKITERDRRMGRWCLRCPVCTQARRRQTGLAFWIVNRLEERMCPFCRAYERVYGRKARQRLPEA